ncbi:MAG: PE-PPE domain-containing protein [Gordonia sp.]|uniref:PE-PPE domain-containing protein n=1 Tax=Gordonia rubripertincta TaxID=36822 RepID=A0ABT4MTE0_GORRU|nr:alpha/beta fold hydrolase [Gordonia rubripertincta]MBA4026245.1 PE-PPE domain-containing protein [Gordonia sp. (in: high G+C Gram-positive bacteria)]MCZ4550273.1 PE-PPE domain-containing protein [Gordonia rubripertincta]
MAMVTVLTVGGTGESYPGDARSEVSGLLAAVTDRLDDRFVSRWVGYPASYGPVPSAGGVSYLDSVQTGVDHLATAIAETPGPIMLIGYSQGCVVIRELLARDGLLRSGVVAAGFVADPHQPPGAVDGCDGFGLAGPGAPLPRELPALWIADPDDVICNASDDSFLRDVADLTAALSVRDLRGWLRSLWQVLTSNSFQNAARTSIRPRQWRKDIQRLRVVAVEIAGYLPARLMLGGLKVVNRRGGRHTAYAAEPMVGSELTGCQTLVQWLQVQATFRAVHAADLGAA